MVYLIHFEKPLAHSRHYIGWTSNLEKRLAHHKNGTGARILLALNLAGIAWKVVRTWPEADGHFERQLHNYKNSPRLCPICNPSTYLTKKKG